MKCSHFNQCGGCYYSIPYPEQVEEKKKELKELFGKDIELIPSPVTKGYRQRMDYVYAFGKLGLRKQGKFDQVVDVKHCQLISEKMNSTMDKVRELLKKHSIVSYDYLNHEGYLRYVIIREAKFTKQLMLGFVTSNEKGEIEKVIDEIKDDVDSVVWSINDTKTDSSFGRIHKTFNDYIEEDFDGVKYKISANVFFQSNPYFAKEIFKEIKGHVKGETLELFSGIGAITLFASENAKNITGVESSNEATELARENAKINNISAEFICQDAGSYITEAKSPDALIVDPPRTGLGRNLCRKILWKKPKKIIIMSCNPKTLAYDLSILEKKYKITEIKALDMFPYTKHIECLCVMEYAC